MKQTPFKVGDRVRFNWKKWQKENGITSRARYSVQITSIDSPTNFSGEKVLNNGPIQVQEGSGFRTKYFTLVKKYKRDNKGRFLGAKPAKAKPFTPDSIVAGAKYTNSIYPAHQYFGVSLGGVKEMLLKTSGGGFISCSKEMRDESSYRYWEAFSLKKQEK